LDGNWKPQLAMANEIDITNASAFAHHLSMALFVVANSLPSRLTGLHASHNEKVEKGQVIPTHSREDAASSVDSERRTTHALHGSKNH
jgi:hypothetical protein